MSAPLFGHLSPLSPLERLVEEFVTTTVPCPVCRVPAGCGCDGLVCSAAASAALEQHMASVDQ